MGREQTFKIVEQISACAPASAAFFPTETPGWRGDGGGLYLEIDANGRMRWALRLTVNGKRRDFGLAPCIKSRSGCVRRRRN
jgi:hypothetical protein